MRTKVDFTLKKKMSLMMPIPLICKTTGYMDKYLGSGNWGNGNPFCEVGKTYVLTEIRDLDNPDGPEFVMQTESLDGSGTKFLCAHYMDYEFMAQYFFVAF